ncbi:MAG TPA: hypothetical protein VM056_04230 [Terriglobales bacterium]|nr:hypothetical protein [Terriglobales bacterium]
MFWATALLLVIVASIMFMKGRSDLGAVFMALASMFMIIAIAQGKKAEPPTEQ